MKKSFWHRYDVNDQTAEMPNIMTNDLRHNEVLKALLNNSQPNNGNTYSLLGMRDPSVAYATVKSPLQQAMDRVAV